MTERVILQEKCWGAQRPSRLVDQSRGYEAAGWVGVHVETRRADNGWVTYVWTGHHPASLPPSGETRWAAVGGWNMWRRGRVIPQKKPGRFEVAGETVVMRPTGWECSCRTANVCPHIVAAAWTMLKAAT